VQTVIRRVQDAETSKSIDFDLIRFDLMLLEARDLGSILDVSQGLCDVLANIGGHYTEYLMFRSQDFCSEPETDHNILPNAPME
jgi:hypothetical protein